MTKEWLTYSRIVVLALGLVFAGFLVWMLPEGMAGIKAKGWWEGVLALLLVLLATLLLFVGFFGSNRMVEKWGEWSTTHEASIVVMIIAAPIYWLLKAVTRKR